MRTRAHSAVRAAEPRADSELPAENDFVDVARDGSQIRDCERPDGLDTPLVREVEDRGPFLDGAGGVRAEFAA